MDCLATRSRDKRHRGDRDDPKCQARHHARLTRLDSAAPDDEWATDTGLLGKVTHAHVGRCTQSVWESS